MIGLAKVLIVDDIPRNRELLRRMVDKMEHATVLAEDGIGALDMIERENPDLALLDIEMPHMNGFEVLEHIKSNEKLKDIPVIMITGNDQIESAARCIAVGADDYIVKPFDPVLLKARISSSLEKKFLRDKDKLYRRQIEEYNHTLQSRVKAQVKEITSAQQSTIFAMAKLAESRDPETGEHLLRLCEYSKVLCDVLKEHPKYSDLITPEYIDDIYAASPLHDIGKVAIPDRILQKPGKLTDEEFDIMKTHTSVGAQMLREIHSEHPNNNFIRIGIEIAESHQEKYNGSGYPNGLEGENIPFSARIMALGDVYDALTSKRCYKEAFSHEKSKSIILEGRGSHFDPDVVDAFLQIEEKFVNIRKTHVDSEKHLLS